jgi:hypothetical protein
VGTLCLPAQQSLTTIALAGAAHARGMQVVEPYASDAVIDGKVYGYGGPRSMARLAVERDVAPLEPLDDWLPLLPWPARSLPSIASDLDRECHWLLTNAVLPADLVTRHRQRAEAVLRQWTPVFTHGDVQGSHVFVDEDDEITGVIDWSDAGQGDALYDLAVLTLGHENHLDDVVTGYGGDVDLDIVRAWWSMRCLLSVRWLVEHGFDPFSPGCEIDVLKSKL